MIWFIISLLEGIFTLLFITSSKPKLSLLDLKADN